MKQNPKTERMLMILCLLFILGQAATENDIDFKTCGTWRHGNVSRNLKSDLTTGCKELVISANNNTLYIQGSITAKCTHSGSILLDSSPQKNQSNFCVFWEPLLDMLIVEVNGKNRTLCGSSGLQENCCTDLSPGYQKYAGLYGIVNGSVKGDIIQHNIMEVYVFNGASANCKKKFCDEASQKSKGEDMIEEVVMKSNATGHVDLPCAQSTVIEMEEGFMGQSFTLPTPRSVPANTIPSVYLPSCLKPASSKKSKVVCTYYRNSTSLKRFQRESSDLIILDDVVGISVENKIITNLPEPVRIRFHHSTLPANHSTRCVSWDTRKDNEVMWRSEGCLTFNINTTETECCCNHLTYFAILVQMEQRATVRHLEALTYITAVGCAVSLVSCLVLFYWLCKQRKKNQSSLVHRGLVVAIFLLCLFFILTGTIANVENITVCKITGTLLHYALLCTLSWMAMEVFHTFLLVRKVFSSTLQPWVFYLGGFGLPTLLVCILLPIDDIYGKRKIVPSEDVTKPYHMCWMLDTYNSRLAHYIINIGLLAIVVSSGAVMLFLVVKEIWNRPEWRKNHVAFLSIWGLTCLFGTTWGLGFLNFGPLSEATLFLFCIINSLQGFFLLLRYYALEWMKKKKESSSEGSSTGSSKQHMLQTYEKS
ncbi:adhesion G-protein coupled receptor G5-like [Myxocyprinus asiaticus]|uniref:adhesion G-protein coupled receptor G5-like n=1 Tax=Myxocyprinus asiaticus TaxID=70543 RepID=UPI00222145CD|nr:adhesion G-protein coupled receptor G5-like [Myxocyprinus asiaticus]XP_051507615.1 adhesion G-protein coupled receptor G5-like [Myxocyprinus asiaticus]